MKGIVITEYIEFVEDTFGFDIAQQMIEGAKLHNDGVYTSVGTYDSSELVKMVMNLSKHTKVEVPELLKAYGNHLFSRFASLYPHFFHDDLKIFDFIEQVDNYIHVEVRKLYPDAELPSVATIKREDDLIEIIYSSKRKFGDFAHGLLLGAVSYFKENITIQKEILVEDGSQVRFTLKRIT